MSSLTNACEGTNGGTVPATNIAGPNPFDSSSVTGVGATKTFTNAQAHSGVTAINLHLPAAVSSSAQLNWSVLPVTPTTDAYVRFYLYLTAYPAFVVGTVAGLVRFLAGASLRAGLVLQPTGELRTINSAGGQISVTTAQVPLNQWVRIEAEITGITATTGTVAARMFSGANLEGPTPDTGGSVSASNGSIGGTVDTLRFGPQSAITLSSAWDSIYDDVAYSDVASPGPATFWVPQSDSPRPRWFNRLYNRARDVVSVPPITTQDLPPQYVQRRRLFQPRAKGRLSAPVPTPGFISGTHSHPGTASFNFTLPPGSTQGGFCLILAANSSATAFTLTITGSTQLLAAPANNMYLVAYSKQLSATDITNGFIAVAATSSVVDYWGLAYDTSITGFDTVNSFPLAASAYGTRNGVSQTFVTAPGVTPNSSSDYMLLISAERTIAAGTTVVSIGQGIQDYYYEDTAITNVSVLAAHFTWPNASTPTGADTVTYSGASGNAIAFLLPLTTTQSVASVPPQVTQARTSLLAVVPFLARRRTTESQPVLTQVIVTTPGPLIGDSVSPRPRWFPRRRPAATQPVPAQQTTVTVTVPVQPVGRRPRLPIVSRRRSAQPILTQVSVTVAALPPQPARSRPFPLPRRRPKSTRPVPVREDFLIVVADMQPGAGVNPPPSVVAAKVVADNPDIVLMPGDLANDGTAVQYGFFDTMYGAIKSRIYPVPGNHDYGNNPPAGDLTNYDTYWGAQARSPSHTYSFDTPTGWHVVAIDSDEQWVGSINNPSATYSWVAADLAANAGKSTIAFCHHPPWAEGVNPTPPIHTGDSTVTQDIRHLHVDSRADLVFVRHTDSSERFPRFGKTATAKPSGIRAFVVGTGGSGPFNLNATGRRTEVDSYQAAAYDQLNSQWFGYLRLWLAPATATSPATYRWEFVSQNAGVLDAGGPVPANGALAPVPQQSRPVRAGWALRKRPRSTQPVPAQVVVTVTGPLVPQSDSPRLKWFTKRRARSTVPVPVTVTVTTQALPPQTATRRPFRVPFRRARNPQPILVTVTVAAPMWIPDSASPRRPWWGRPRARQLLSPIPGVQPPSRSITLTRISLEGGRLTTIVVPAPDTATLE